jgi:hypothetical protein
MPTRPQVSPFPITEAVLGSGVLRTASVSGSFGIYPIRVLNHSDIFLPNVWLIGLDSRLRGQYGSQFTMRVIRIWTTDNCRDGILAFLCLIHTLMGWRGPM